VGQDIDPANPLRPVLTDPFYRSAAYFNRRRREGSPLFWRPAHEWIPVPVLAIVPETPWRRRPWRGLEDVEFATLDWVPWYNTQLREPMETRCPDRRNRSAAAGRKNRQHYGWRPTLASPTPVDPCKPKGK
jgi:hypothetical protein